MGKQCLSIAFFDDGLLFVQSIEVFPKTVLLGAEQFPVAFQDGGLLGRFFFGNSRA
ncbi:hypothetical protein [Treponema primitia]|uniref:hypothetical protein n=1 Tax=Treponema primitia TaxID=88058 RepID=UPI001FDFFD1F|nr:hypothetical protein [Treponema primitia]